MIEIHVELFFYICIHIDNLCSFEIPHYNADNFSLIYKKEKEVIPLVLQKQPLAIKNKPINIIAYTCRNLKNNYSMIKSTYEGKTNEFKPTGA